MIALKLEVSNGNLSSGVSSKLATIVFVYGLVSLLSHTRSELELLQFQNACFRVGVTRVEGIQKTTKTPHTCSQSQRSH
jgi:hypothetical protein